MSPESTTPSDPTRSRTRTLVRAAVLLASWVVLTVLVGLVLLLTGSRTTTLAGHDAVVRPDLSGTAVVHTGPVLPDVRVPSGSRIGVDVTLGKTDAGSINDLVQRYALIATRPEAQQQRISETVTDLALASALRGAGLAAVPIALWLLVGAGRRRELWRRAPSRRGAVGVVAVVLVAAAVWQPWHDDEPVGPARWQSLGDFLGPEVALPAEARDVEVLGDVTTNGTRRLIESAIDTYDKSQAFYETAADAAADLDLREPAEGESVVALVSDRHDNIGMDDVSRAIADRAGAGAVFDAGDDTSTGSSYEAFSLDSLDAAWDGIDQRWAVPGNHDNGLFVGTYLADHGWDVLDGTVVDGPSGSRLLGAADPRSSGLGSWRDETGLGFTEVEDRLADAACAADEDGDRVTTVLVHDANLGREALARGCTDLVVGGHLHLRSGPTPVVGENGSVGWTYTTGTTGGAAYAFALGSKPRRAAEVSLITYAGGRPTGIQSVLLQTNGSYVVEPWAALTYAETSD